MGNVSIENKSPEEITTSDVDDARIILGLETEAALLALARDAGDADVPSPFIMTDELRRLGEHRAGRSPEEYRIPAYLCRFVARTLAGEIVATAKQGARRSSQSSANAVRSK